MSRNYLKIREAVRFSLIDQALIKVQDDYAGAFKPPEEGAQHSSGLGTSDQQQVAGLHVRISATHAGIITRNNGFYLPDRMKKGASSFTDNYPKPVLLHHEDGQDPVGRIIEALYIDTSGALQDSFNLAKGLVVKDRKGKEKGIITEVLMKDFVSGKMPFAMQIDTIVTLLRDSLLEQDGYDGLGHIDIIAAITDQQAIERLLDGRYLTGSVGATTDKAVCSVCRQDWTEAGKCEHKPGAIYDGAKCFIIAGSLDYDEYSFVNVPADRHSRVLELHYNGIQDSIEFAEEYSGRIYEARLGFPQYDSAAKEDKGMAGKKKDPKAKDQEEVIIEDEVKTDPDTPESANQTTEESTNVDDANQDNSSDISVQDTTNEEEQDVKNKKEKEVIEDSTETDDEPDAITAFMDTTELTDELRETFYNDVFWPEVEASFKDAEFTLEQLEVEKLEDAKLGTEKRKKLAKSTFCGPARSFPVPDCAHVVAARRLIGRYKGSGDKSKILACVSRKAKALGCDNSKKKSDSVKPVETDKIQEALQHGRVMHMVIAALEEAQHYSNEVVLDDPEVKMLQGILKRLAIMVGKDEFVKAVVVEELALDPSCEEALADEVIKLEDTVGNLRDQLDALRKEYSSLFKDMENLQDTLADATSVGRKAVEEKLSILKALHDGKVDNEADYSVLSDSDLKSEIDRVLEQVDMTKIVDKLGDGMARNPTESVDDPTAIQDEDRNQKSSTNLLTPEEIEQLQAWHLKMQFTPGGKQVVDAYVKRLQLEGRLPSNSEIK